MTPSLPRAESILAGEVVLPARDFDATFAFFTERLGFRVASIFPADAPRVAVVEGYGLRLRLDAEAHGDPGVLHLSLSGLDPASEDPAPRMAPNGTRVLFINADPPLCVPRFTSPLVVTRAEEASPWHRGRAGLFYRDLLPHRGGGAVIASHIRIPEAGPVPDYVHYHKVQFQMIYCRRGWVRVVYEDQGEPFVMREGDCVLQPPRIRHRVLESSAGLEVVEVSSPALHETCADPGLALPNGKMDPLREFSGQRFLRHVAAEAPWRTDGESGVEVRDVGISEATHGMGGACVLRASHGATTFLRPPKGGWRFLFVLTGEATLRAGETYALSPDDACALPAGQPYAMEGCTPGYEVLEVTLPA